MPAIVVEGLRKSYLGVIAAWGVGGLLVALRFFRWEPKRRAGRRERRREPERAGAGA
jgi:hypothetical protein